jgi:OmpA-OmpF porin, OOP family
MSWFYGKIGILSFPDSFTKEVAHEKNVLLSDCPGIPLIQCVRINSGGYTARLLHAFRCCWRLQLRRRATSGNTAGQGDAQAYHYGGDLLLHLLPDNNLVPYLAAGYGGITLDRDNQETITRGAFDYGAGIKYFVTDNLALRGDFRHLVFRDGETLFNYEYTVGITYQFGEKMPAPAPAAQPEPEVAPAPEAPIEPVPAAEPTPEKMKYCVNMDIEFDIDKAEIRPQYHDEVAKVGDFMKKYPTTTAVIEGYTDEVGSDDYNMKLSQRRAESVINYLVEKFGIERSRLSAKGYGPTRRIAYNNTAEGRQKNRRINAIIDCVIKK